MDESEYKELEAAAIHFMYLASQELKFDRREGDSDLASLNRLLPDFYEIFTNTVELAYMRQWGTVETVVILAPIAIMFLLLFLILASRTAQVSMDLLVSLCVSCSHIWHHGLHLSQAASDGPSHRLLSRPLRVVRWIDGTDRWAEKAWSVMRLTKPDNKVEMMEQLCNTVRRVKDEKNILQKRRSIVKEGAMDHH